MFALAIKAEDLCSCQRLSQEAFFRASDLLQPGAEGSSLRFPGLLRETGSVNETVSVSPNYQLNNEQTGIPFDNNRRTLFYNVFLSSIFYIVFLFVSKLQRQLLNSFLLWFYPQSCTSFAAAEHLSQVLDEQFQPLDVRPRTSGPSVQICMQAARWSPCSGCLF